VLFFLYSCSFRELCLDIRWCLSIESYQYDSGRVTRIGSLFVLLPTSLPPGKHTHESVRHRLITGPNCTARAYYHTNVLMLYFYTGRNQVIILQKMFQYSSAFCISNGISLTVMCFRNRMKLCRKQKRLQIAPEVNASAAASLRVSWTRNMPFRLLASMTLLAFLRPLH
jgi:hypothetical protein